MIDRAKQKRSSLNRALSFIVAGAIVTGCEVSQAIDVRAPSHIFWKWCRDLHLVCSGYAVHEQAETRPKVEAYYCVLIKRGGSSMAIKIGDKVPAGTFGVMKSEGPASISTDELFKGKTVVLFSVPGA